MEESQRQLFNAINIEQTRLMERINRIEGKLYDKPKDSIQDGDTNKANTIENKQSIENKGGVKKRPNKDKPNQNDTKNNSGEVIEEKVVHTQTKQIPVFQIPPKKPLIPEGMQSICWIIFFYLFHKVLFS